ncbi:hypothetical protein [Halosimplex halobium]|uniref:hypothetical protein n=1 Tax=Halosimplex halobium TaxID=3396618 RepID=UPI003F55B28B
MLDAPRRRFDTRVDRRSDAPADDYRRVDRTDRDLHLPADSHGHPEPCGDADTRDGDAIADAESHRDGDIYPDRDSDADPDPDRDLLTHADGDTDGRSAEWELLRGSRRERPRRRPRR